MLRTGRLIKRHLFCSFYFNVEKLELDLKAARVYVILNRETLSFWFIQHEFHTNNCVVFSNNAI